MAGTANAKGSCCCCTKNTICWICKECKCKAPTTTSTKATKTTLNTTGKTTSATTVSTTTTTKMTSKATIPTYNTTKTTTPTSVATKPTYSTIRTTTLNTAGVTTRTPSTTMDTKPISTTAATTPSAMASTSSEIIVTTDTRRMETTTSAQLNAMQYSNEESKFPIEGVAAGATVFILLLIGSFILFVKFRKHWRAKTTEHSTKGHTCKGFNNAAYNDTKVTQGPGIPASHYVDLLPRKGNEENYDVMVVDNKHPQTLTTKETQADKANLENHKPQNAVYEVVDDPHLEANENYFALEIEDVKGQSNSEFRNENDENYFVLETGDSHEKAQATVPTDTYFILEKEEKGQQWNAVSNSNNTDNYFLVESENNHPEIKTHSSVLANDYNVLNESIPPVITEQHQDSYHQAKDVIRQNDSNGMYDTLQKPFARPESLDVDYDHCKFVPKLHDRKAAPQNDDYDHI